VDTSQQLPGAVGGERQSRAQVGVLDFQRAQPFQARRVAAALHRRFEGAHASFRREGAPAKASELLAQVMHQLLQLGEGRSLRPCGV
jgi:hypothetical protein